jgi:hypothetical protein
MVRQQESPEPAGSTAHPPRCASPRTSAAGRSAVVRTAAVAALALALAGCASRSAAGADGSGSIGAGAAPSSTAATSSSPSATASLPVPVNPGGPVDGAGPLATPAAQVGGLPPGAKLVGFQGATRSSDGRTLYLLAEARGGACGVYDVVVKETSTRVQVGLASVPAKTSVVCPMIVRLETFPVHLSAPVGSRAVVDLATGRTISPLGTR